MIRQTYLPEGFVYLHEVDTSIVCVMSYASTQNFIGSKIEGYYLPYAILTAEAAKALSLVQQQFIRDGFSLVVYDAYRPQKAVDHFVSWGMNKKDVKMRDSYYPYINKEQIFDLGYVARLSSHSRGSTVDVSIIKLGKSVLEPVVEMRNLSNGKKVPYLDDGTEDMYTSFDLFDEASWSNTKLIPTQHLEKRQYLAETMLQNGFVGYDKEWWHFTLENEPFHNTYFDFNVM